MQAKGGSSTSNVGNHWVEIQIWGQRSVTYIGNYLEWTGATDTMKKYYYAGATRVAMREGSSSVYYLLGDHLGSTSLVTDPGGAILSAARYDPWGGQRYASGTTPTAYRYTGQRDEKGLGLYFYGARFYDPQLSRFLSADSIIPQQQGVQAWDRFAYVNNNPLKYTDPTGHFVWFVPAAIGAAIGAVVGGAAYAITNQGDSFNGWECAAAAGVGAVSGALIGSGIGLVAAAATAASTASAGVAAGAAASGIAVGSVPAATIATTTSLISAGTSAGVAGMSYMVQTPGEFETRPFVIDSAVAGAVGYYSPGQGLGARMGLSALGAEITYFATASNPTLPEGLAAMAGGAVGGAVDYGLGGLSPSIKELAFLCPGPVADTVFEFGAGLGANLGGMSTSIVAQRLALGGLTK